MNQDLEATPGIPGGAAGATPGVPQAPAAEPAVESMPSPAELLRQAERLAAEHHDAWLRARADAENIRKRAQEDVAKAHKFAVESLSSELLAVRDSLEAALSNANQSAETLREGVQITLRQLSSVFERFSIREIDPAGEKFDPHFHQAMSMVPAEQPANTVVQVFQKGYRLHERVLRPALVVVAKPADA
jgi:molecular chaperone GrpE